MRNTLTIAVLALAVAGCDSLTDPMVEAEFEWTEVEDPSTAVEGVEPSILLGELFILGHVPTPTRCYRLDYDLDRRDNRLNIRIDAMTSNPQNCDDSPGAWRYILSIYNLKTRTYEIHITHAVEGAETHSFTETVMFH